MRKILLLIILPTILATGVLALIPKQILAVDVISPVCNNPDIKPTQLPEVCKDNQTNANDNNNPLFGPDGIITKGVQILTIIVGIAAVIVIIISGLTFVTSGGGSENLAKAKRAITYAVAGLIIALMAQLIVTFVLNKV